MVRRSMCESIEWSERRGPGQMGGSGAWWAPSKRGHHPHWGSSSCVRGLLCQGEMLLPRYNNTVPISNSVIPPFPGVLYLLFSFLFRLASVILLSLCLVARAVQEIRSAYLSVGNRGRIFWPWHWKLGVLCRYLGVLGLSMIQACSLANSITSSYFNHLIPASIYLFSAYLKSRKINTETGEIFHLLYYPDVHNSQD